MNRYYISINMYEGKGAVELRFNDYYIISYAESNGFPFITVAKCIYKINKMRLIKWMQR